MKRALAALALTAGLLPALAWAQTVRTTFGLGNVREPTAACGTDGCQILIFDSVPTGNPPVNCPAGTNYTEAGCARRGPDEMLSSGLLIQSSRAYSYYPIPGTFTIEENTATGAVTIVNNPDGTTSGHVNNVFLDLDLGFDTFLIPSALNFDYGGGTGTHINDAGGNRIVWNNNLAPPNGPGLPYRIQGCLTCQSGSGSGCGLLGLGPPPGTPEGTPACDALVQPTDPRRRVMPNWVSEDGFATWHFPDDGNGAFTGGDESIVADSADIGGVNNGGGWVFFGFRGRECGTKNVSEGDPFHPNLGKPDYNCDGNADWTYGLGAIDEPACFDTTRWCTGTTTECNFDADCPAPKTCDALPDGVCQGTSNLCFIASECGPKICSNNVTQVCSNSLECGPGVCQGTTTACTAQGQCGASTPCVPTFAAICVPSVPCVPLADKLCTGTSTGCTSDANCGGAAGSCKATSTPIPAVGGDFICRPLVECTEGLPTRCSLVTPTKLCTTNADCAAGEGTCVPFHTAGTPCQPGCFENISDTSQCNKLDRSLVVASSYLSLMRDPDHDHFPLRGRAEIVEDLDMAQTRWCSGNSAIGGSLKKTPKQLCSTAADCPRTCVGGPYNGVACFSEGLCRGTGGAGTCTGPSAGETCDVPAVVQWCSGTSTPCTTDADCTSPSLCAKVGTVYFPPGQGSAWNTNSVIVALVPFFRQTFTITAAGRTGLDGATGYGSPNDVIVWNGPTQPYRILQGGCYFCSATGVGKCPNIALNDRLITCDAGQLGDPEVREWPDWVSYDQGASFEMRNANGRPGDPNPAHVDPIIESYQSAQPNLTSLVTNNGPVQLRGYLRRECGTTNDPNAGNTVIYKFCSREDEFCEVDADCPPIPEVCDPAAGTCIGSGQAGCPGIPCPIVGQICAAKDDPNPARRALHRPAGNPYNPRSGKPDRDCDRKVDPGVFPLESDSLDPEFPDPLPLPPDVVEDVCITYAQTSDADANGDGHGDQCSCGDQNEDGAVNVSDLVDINTAIFTPALATLLCDTNNDSRCNVSDIVDGNLEIFSQGTTANCVYNLLDSKP